MPTTEDDHRVNVERERKYRVFQYRFGHVSQASIDRLRQEREHRQAKWSYKIKERAANKYKSKLKGIYEEPNTHSESKCVPCQLSNRIKQDKASKWQQLRGIHRLLMWVPMIILRGLTWLCMTRTPKACTKKTQSTI